MNYEALKDIAGCIAPILTSLCRASSCAHVTSCRSTQSRLTLNSPTLTRSHQPSCAHSIASPLLTRLAWDVLIPDCAAIESVNS